MRIAFQGTSAMCQARTTVNAFLTLQLTRVVNALPIGLASALTAPNAATLELTATMPTTDSANSQARILPCAPLQMVSFSPPKVPSLLHRRLQLQIRP